jgi:DNA-binding beta-propeller fold protein YncE
MRIVIGVYLALAISGAMAQPAAKPEGGAQSKKDVKHPAPVVAGGVKTPGVLIPFSLLKAYAELPVAPSWTFAADSLLVPNPAAGTLVRLDSKTNKLGDAILGEASPDLSKPCGGAANGFGSLWIPSCGTQSLTRIDPKTWKLTAKVSAGVGSATPAVAATADSIWLLTDDKTTLSRIDPDQNRVVSELRLAAGCNTLTFGETALWLTCPSENRIVRVNPETNLVEKRIEVSAGPHALAIGENSIWVLCLKDGKVEQIDPKTNKVSKTIELEVAGSGEGGIAVSPGTIWVTLPGFPLTRIDSATGKVMQQFWGAGGGAIQYAFNSLWLSNLHLGTLWRIDPRRVIATLAE